MIVDNFEIISSLLPERSDGDTFWYTELLDRSKSSGNNKGRRARTFWHQSREDLQSQADQIRTACEQESVRAYFRPTPRSFKEVGKAFVRHVVEQSLTNNWESMRHRYSHICGITPVRTRMIWVWDVDSLSAPLLAPFRDLPELVAIVPSRKGYHCLTTPFNTAKFDSLGASFHKNNPTNLYIPTNAA